MSPEKNNERNIGLILLAAGESSRLGHPKQLLLYGNRTFLQHSLQIARASNAHPIVVVLGAYADTIRREIESEDVHIVVNTDWQEGMASSIRYGVKTLVQINPLAEGVILLPCDQPYITTVLLNSLITTHQTSGKPIVACGYEDTFGPPVFFQRNLFPELLLLRGDVGAKGVVSQHVNEVEVVLFPDGHIDIDTEADYQDFSKKQP
jgi:molybdenum cofactor cytidylyltransferase